MLFLVPSLQGQYRLVKFLLDCLSCCQFLNTSQAGECKYILRPNRCQLKQNPKPGYHFQQHTKF